MKRREVTICFETFTFPDDADRVDAALVDGEVRHAFCGGREIRIIDLKSLVASYVELAFGRCPAVMIRDGVEDREWLSLAHIRGKGAEAEAICGRMVRSLTDFEREPGTIRALRSELGAIVESGRQGLVLTVVKSAGECAPR